MKDEKIKSLVESICNILIGIVISFIANIIIFPLFGFHTTMTNLAGIGIIYTCISLARSYMIRRLFVNGFYETIVIKKILAFLKR